MVITKRMDFLYLWIGSIGLIDFMLVLIFLHVCHLSGLRTLSWLVNYQFSMLVDRNFKNGAL